MKLRALVVEDDFTQRFGLKMALSKEGYEITEAEDGKTAIQIIKSHKKFDLAILDYNLGDIKGTTVAKEIKKIGAAKKVVLVSSQVDEFIGSIDRDIEVFSKPIKESDVPKITAIGYRREDLKNLKSGIETKSAGDSVNIKAISNFGNSTAIETLLLEIKKNNDRNLILFDKSQINQDLLYTVLVKQQEIQRDIFYITDELKKIEEQRLGERIAKLETTEMISEKSREKRLNLYNIAVAIIGVVVSILIAAFS